MTAITEIPNDDASGQSAASTSKTGMTIDEQLLKAEELKSLGNSAYEQGELTEALNKCIM